MNAPHRPIDFYFDFSSPYSYIASEWIEALAARHGRTVQWNAMLLGASFQVTEIRKGWEYETITLQSPDDVVKVLTPKGVIGWETTGIAFVNPGGTTLLLKRPR